MKLDTFAVALSVLFVIITDTEFSLHNHAPLPCIGGLSKFNEINAFPHLR